MHFPKNVNTVLRGQDKKSKTEVMSVSLGPPQFCAQGKNTAQLAQETENPLGRGVNRSSPRSALEHRC